VKAIAIANTLIDMGLVYTLRQQIWTNWVAGRHTVLIRQEMKYPETENQM